MAKVKAHNLIVVTKDGSLTVATGNGQLKTINQSGAESGFAMKLSKLIAKRQEAGKDLTTALKDGGLDVEGRTQTDVWDPRDPPSPSPKESKKDSSKKSKKSSSKKK